MAKPKRNMRPSVQIQQRRRQQRAQQQARQQRRQPEPSPPRRPLIRRRIARGLDYSFAVICFGIALWLMSPGWLAAAAVCLVVAILNPGERLQHHVARKLFRAPTRRQEG